LCLVAIQIVRLEIEIYLDLYAQIRCDFSPRPISTASRNENRKVESGEMKYGNVFRLIWYSNALSFYLYFLPTNFLVVPSTVLILKHIILSWWVKIRMFNNYLHFYHIRRNKINLHILELSKQVCQWTNSPAISKVSHKPNFYVVNLSNLSLNCIDI